jgi:predicted RNA-binding Zn-ribbon protein involved in translation (DUF1610 family)
MNCPNCGSDNIQKSVSIGKSTETGSVGPCFIIGKILSGVEQMYCDICLDCGEITRFYIKDTKKNWLKG